MAFDFVLLLMCIRARCPAQLSNIAIQIHSFFGLFVQQETIPTPQMLHVVYYPMLQIVYVSMQRMNAKRLVALRWYNVNATLALHTAHKIAFFNERYGKWLE